MAKAPSRSRSRGGASRAGSGRSGAPKSRTTARRTSSAPRSGSSSTGYPILCSECYSEFQLRSDSQGAQITCPECMHLGSVAASDAMAQISIAKKAEKSWLIKTIVPAAIMLLGGFVYIGMLSSNPSMSDGLNYGLLGGLTIMLIITVAMAFKYESNRYEVYF